MGPKKSSDEPNYGSRLLNIMFVLMIGIVLMILYVNNNKEYSSEGVYSVNAAVDGVTEEEENNHPIASAAQKLLLQRKLEELKAKKRAREAGAGTKQGGDSPPPPSKEEDREEEKPAQKKSSVPEEEAAEKKEREGETSSSAKKNDHENNASPSTSTSKNSGGTGGWRNSRHHEYDFESPQLPVAEEGGDIWHTSKVVHTFRGMDMQEYCGGGTHSRNPESAPPKSGSAVCELAVLYTRNCKIEQKKETFLECLDRIGPSRFLPLLPSKCTDSEFFQKQLEKEADKKQASAYKHRLRRGIYERTQVYLSRDEAKYIPPSERPGSKFGQPRVCGNGCKHYPISFSMPKSNIVKKVSRTKLFDFLPYVPANFPISDYNRYYFSYNDEWLSHTLHRHSMFAFTHRRGGWDCMRHLEIMSSGAVPYFADIANCPRNTLTHLPKELIKEAMALEGVKHVGQAQGGGAINNAFLRRNRGGHVNFNKPGVVHNKTFDLNKYYDLADKINEHAREYMTTQAMVSHMLRVIEYEEPKSVLLIGRYLGPSGYDYIHVSIEHGLSDLGINTTVAGGSRDFIHKMERTAEGEDVGLEPALNGVTTKEIEKFRMSKVKPYHPVAGLMWQYGWRQFPFVVRPDGAGRNDQRLAKEILDNKFDLVIYTYVDNEPVQRKPFWSAVHKALDRSKIIFVNHNDDVGDPGRGDMESCRLGTLFKREMHDGGC